MKAKKTEEEQRQSILKQFQKQKESLLKIQARYERLKKKHPGLTIDLFDDFFEQKHKSS